MCFKRVHDQVRMRVHVLSMSEHQGRVLKQAHLGQPLSPLPSCQVEPMLLYISLSLLCKRSIFVLATSENPSPLQQLYARGKPFSRDRPICIPTVQIGVLYRGCPKLCRLSWRQGPYRRWCISCLLDSRAQKAQYGHDSVRQLYMEPDDNVAACSGQWAQGTFRSPWLPWSHVNAGDAPTSVIIVNCRVTELG